MAVLKVKSGDEWVPISGSWSDGLTTETLPLGTPVDTGRSSSSSRALLQTQADANGYFDEDITANRDQIEVNLKTMNNQFVGVWDYLATQALAISKNEVGIAFNADEIAKKPAVVTLSQSEYDALGADEIDNNTLYLIT